MLDASKYASDARLIERDPHGHMFALDVWSPRHAEELARQEAIDLTEDHWQVIFALRERYRAHGPEPARELVRHLDEEFASPGGRKRLYELFPGGPVRQASRIAGLPQPAGSLDHSFGSRM